ncbi:MAG: hypothetical protein KatS3mg092_0330 [Patescibacteria group bacterium]|nr:MAG: hypothetical protein KatS3mg092_0330 [Patescibacteria group bacterium]
MKRISYLLISLFIINYSLLIIHSVFAVCPVCTVAVVGGIEITRMLGVDDLITGVWVGGLIVSMAFWLSDWFAKKKFLKPIIRETLSLVIFYLLTIPFLIWNKMIGIKGNVFLGVDKIVFGVLVGSIIFILGVLTEKFLRRLNKGKVFIYYQKVIIPVLFLTIISLIFYFLVKS